MKCGICKRKFSIHSNLFRHIWQIHLKQNNGGSLNLSEQWGGTNNRHDSDVESLVSRGSNLDNLSLDDLVRTKWNSIKTYFKCQRIVDIANFRLYNQTEVLKDFLSNLWTQHINSQVKAQASLGFVLQHKTSHRYRYFHSSPNNTALFSTPIRVNSLDEMVALGDRITQMDLLQWAYQNRSNSSWVVRSVANITLHFTKLPFAKFGSPPSIFPKHILACKSIMTLRNNCHKEYKDNLCFFRALALSKFCSCSNRCHCLPNIEHHVVNLYKTFAEKMSITVSAQEFQGVTYDHLLYLEDIFHVKITVYELKSNSNAKFVRQSFKKYKHHLNLCQVKYHFCYIRDIKSFCKCYQCSSCSQCFVRSHSLMIHRKSCAKSQSKLLFDKDYFHPPSTLFSQIFDQTKIVFPEATQYYPFRATFDIECFLSPSTVSNTSKLTFNSTHELMSVSVASNVPGYMDAVCFISEGDVDELIEKFVAHLHTISNRAYEILHSYYLPYLEKLDNFIENRLKIESYFSKFSMSSPRHYNSRSVSDLKTNFLSYIHELPVIGFNSQKYDLNVIHAPLVRNLLRTDQIKFVIKRDSSLKCLKTLYLKFLDITNYIAPGFSYDNFIKAYECELQRGFFPYEYVDSLAKLNDNALPPHSAFYSSLHQSNISLDDYNFCKRVWDEKKMSSLKDFLVWYNNRDVEPFLEAIEKQFGVYRARGIDMFKDGVSVPSLATKWLFLESNSNHFSIPLINSKHSDLYQTIRSNIIGGPAIVFHRYHEAGKTNIRSVMYGDEAKVCKRIYGFDANALYLWSTMQVLPTGSMVRRQAKDSFRPKMSDYYGVLSLEWLEYIAQREQIYIQHKFNKGEKRLGQHGIPVDGFCLETNTVFQFHGCLFHGCQIKNCPLTKNVTINPINGKTMIELHDNTILKESYIKALGYRLVKIYECQWKELKLANSNCKTFVESYFNSQMINNCTMNEQDILNSVRNDKIFGLIECDIHVPLHLRSDFAEMPPIFKHANLTRTDLSMEMLSFAEKNKLYSSPQRTLIGSYFGKKVLVLTSLLKWYLSHGLIVTKIYQVVQFKPFKCFEHFGESVCMSRREGDKDPSKKIIVETAKLSGNVIYGTTITNKERFNDVKYVTSPETASKMVNNRHYLGMSELADDVFEIHLSKPRVKCDTPIVIGFAILQYAKLRMLEFYYDLMAYYFDKKDFQYCTMDTDSAYLAMSGDFEDMIIPQKRHEFYSNYDKWFVPLFCEHHRQEFINCKTLGREWKMDECCRQSEKFHKRTPGLFKEEFQGDGIIALNSKTYYCFGDDKPKLSTKGIMKRLNSFQKNDFLGVLFQKKTVYGTNRGIMRHNNKIKTYTQVRAGLSYFYAKRKVHKDGVSTFPLDI